MANEKILVVDDEPAIAMVIQDRLLGEGYRVRLAADGPAALTAVAQDPPDLLILDLMLPGMDGLDVLRRLRQGDEEAASLPVIILTARDDEVDVVVGLELGADDYVVKPFNPRELVARLRAVLRRRRETLALAGRLAEIESQAVPRLSDQSQHSRVLHIDPAARRAWFQRQLLDLRPREFDLLHYLAQHAGQVLSRDVLLDEVWGIAEYIDGRTVDVHVHRLRQKLAKIDPSADPIQTERGVGYRFEP